MDDLLLTFRARIEEAIGGRQKALAFEKLTEGSFRRTTVQSWIDGKTWPDVATLVAFAKATNRPLAFFIPETNGALPFGEEQVSSMIAVKNKGAEFLSLIDALGSGRELSIARTKIEEAVMWAMQHLAG